MSLGLLSLKAFSQKRGFKPSDKRYILVLLLSAIAEGRSLTISLTNRLRGKLIVGFSFGLVSVFTSLGVNAVYGQQV